MTGTLSNTLNATSITELFPAVNRICCTDLRESVVTVWCEAIRVGNRGRGWKLDTLRAIPFTLLAGNTNLRFVEHLNSCVNQCIAIASVLSETFADRVPIHMDTLIAGALLADVGKLLEFETDDEDRPIQGEQGKLLRHPFTGVAICYKYNVPEAVMHIVATHSYEGDRTKRSIESIIFHHADFIDFDIANVLSGKS